ncbi:MAG: hypothetical protein QF654_06410 [Alphaproteobacteria bacterium]|jgi:hypothetical protein|nr:hypothetical protein [Alphaproteobacteria bacterium]
MPPPAHIGLDFDNTVAGYDRVFLEAGREAGLLPDAFIGTKKEIRDAIRSGPEGDIGWQRLQGQVYGKLMSRAALIEGVAEFLIQCRERGVPVSVISHKTEFGHFDSERINLHQAARRWMTEHGFFDAERFAIPEERVHFEPDRAGKIARICEVGCSHFIDDLAEVFHDPSFPEDVDAILFAAGEDEPPEGPFAACRDWNEISHVVLG